MTKDDVLKKRGEVFDAAARVARAGKAIESLNQQLEAARTEYNDAQQALSVSRREADALEASAVAEVVKGVRDDGIPVLLPMDAVR